MLYGKSSSNFNNSFCSSCVSFFSPRSSRLSVFFPSLFVLSVHPPPPPSIPPSVFRNVQSRGTKVLCWIALSPRWWDSVTRRFPQATETLRDLIASRGLPQTEHLLTSDVVLRFTDIGVM